MRNLEEIREIFSPEEIDKDFQTYINLYSNPARLPLWIKQLISERATKGIEIKEGHPAYASKLMADKIEREEQAITDSKTRKRPPTPKITYGNTNSI